MVSATNEILLETCCKVFRIILIVVIPIDVKVDGKAYYMHSSSICM